MLDQLLDIESHYKNLLEGATGIDCAVHHLLSPEIKSKQDYWCCCMLGLKILKFFYFVFYFQFCRQNKLFFRLHYPSGVESMRLGLGCARDHNSWPNIDLSYQMSRLHPRSQKTNCRLFRACYINKSQADTFSKAIIGLLDGKGV